MNDRIEIALRARLARLRIHSESSNEFAHLVMMAVAIEDQLYQDANGTGHLHGDFVDGLAKRDYERAYGHADYINTRYFHVLMGFRICDAIPVAGL